MTILRTPWFRRRKAAGDQVLVFVSRFDSDSTRSARALFRYSVLVLGSALRAPGCLGAALLARPVKGAYYTVSRWQDEASLVAYARQGAHRSAVKALHAVGDVDGVLMSWWADAAARRPSWREVARRTAAEQRGPYRGPQPGTAPAEPAGASPAPSG